MAKPFDPPPESPKFATYTPVESDRRPAWKYHKNLGHVKNAFHNHNYFRYKRGTIEAYEWTGTEWKRIDFK